MTPAIDIHSVSLLFPGLEAPALKNMSYQIQPGDFIVILGSNGSGKSSLLKLLDRRLVPTSGSVSIQDKKINQFTSRELSKTIITLTQNCHESLFPSLTVFENFQLFSSAQKRQRQFFSQYLEKFNPNLPSKLDQIVDRLSGGEKQALALALSVLNPPKILLLDEHTSALDPKTGKQLMALTQQVIRENNMTCVLTTHDLEIAMHYGNRILALRHGEIFHTIDHHAKTALDKKTLLAACY